MWHHIANIFVKRYYVCTWYINLNVYMYEFPKISLSTLSSYKFYDYGTF